MERIPKPPNAICTWCKHYDPRYRDCSMKNGMVVHDAWNPRRCTRYEGPEVEGENLNKYMEVIS